MKKILIVLFLSLCLSGCGSDKMSEIKKIMAENKYVIVDVRTKEEYNQGHLIDSINIPYNELQQAKLDNNKVILVYCASGNRSSMAYNILTNLGYEVYDMGAFSKINLPKE